jgi:hypothetical protein
VIQHVGITLIMTRLETGGKCLRHGRGLRIHNSDTGTNGHD